MNDDRKNVELAICDADIELDDSVYKLYQHLHNLIQNSEEKGIFDLTYFIDYDVCGGHYNFRFYGKRKETNEEYKIRQEKNKIAREKACAKRKAKKNKEAEEHRKSELQRIKKEKEEYKRLKKLYG